MKTNTVCKYVLAFVIFALAFFMSGCNTWKGAGEDIERAGEKMQDSDK